MSDLPMQQKDHPVHNVPEPTEEYQGLVTDIYSQKASNDYDEVVSGTRFSDTGSRIPGNQKARNDNYDRKLKSR